MSEFKREIWVHEMRMDSGEYAPIVLSPLGDKGGTTKGVTAGYRLKSDARQAGRLVTWGNVRHRLVKYVPAPPTTGKEGI